MIYKNPYTSFNWGASDGQQRRKYCQMLEDEYYADHVSIDDDNIDSKYLALGNAQKLKACAVYVPMVRTFTSEENPNYSDGVIRRFTIKGKKPSRKVLSYLDDLYQQSHYDQQCAAWEHFTALSGTVFIRPTFDFRTGLLRWFWITPSEESLQVGTDPFAPAQALSLSYSIGNKDDKVIHTWDWHRHIIEYTENGQSKTAITPHGYQAAPNAVGGLPWTILRYSVDQRRFYGPFDGGLASLALLRSFLLADSVHRTQASMYEILVMSGYTPNEAKKAIVSMINGRAIVAQNKKHPDGSEEKQDPHYISPDGIEPEKVLDAYFRIYDHIRQTRGHSKMNFEESKEVQSFEAQRLAQSRLRRRQIMNRPYLASMEQNNLQLLIHANNQIPGNPRLPEDLEVTIDWIDQMEYGSVKDYIDVAERAVNRNWMTSVDVIKQLNPGLTEEEAAERYEEIKKANEEKQDQDITDENDEPIT